MTTAKLNRADTSVAGVVIWIVGCCWVHLCRWLATSRWSVADFGAGCSARGGRAAGRKIVGQVASASFQQPPSQPDNSRLNSDGQAAPTGTTTESLADFARQFPCPVLLTPDNPALHRARASDRSSFAAKDAYAEKKEIRVCRCDQQQHIEVKNQCASSRYFQVG